MLIYDVRNKHFVASSIEDLGRPTW